MENVPLERPSQNTPTAPPPGLPRLADLIRSSKQSSRTKSSSRSTKIRALSPLNLTADHSTASNQDKISASAEDSQLLTPPASQPQSSEATPEPVEIMAQSGSSPNSSSRKRTRNVPSASSVLDSPNPKARKQQRTVQASDDELSDNDAAAGPSRPAATRKSKRKGVAAVEDDEASVTPVRQTKQPVPKTDKIPIRLKPTSTAGPKSRRKSAPQAVSRKKKKVPAVDPSLPPELDSDGDDPLLLVGEDEWMPVPWKPIFNDSGDVFVKKEEDEEAGFRLLVDTPSASSSSLQQTTSNEEMGNGMDDHAFMQETPAGPSAQSPEIEQDPILNQTAHAFSPSPSPALDMSFMSEHPDADSSFVGMEIDEDKDVEEFEVPLRTDSPPSRRRRSSNVSQRQPTPGITGSSPSRPPQNQKQVTPPPHVMSPAGRSPLAGSILGQMSPGPLRLPPITPFRLKRKSVAPASPAPYPSPAFKGNKLGSLSPEKGRGPSRGALPALRESHITAPEFGTLERIQSESTEEDDGGSIKSSHQLANSLSGNGQGNTSRGFADSEYDAVHAAPANQDEVEDDEDDEEAENSMQVERQLTEGLSSDEEEGAHDGMEFDLIQLDSPVKSSGPQEEEPKEEELAETQTSPHNSMRSDESQSHSSVAQTLAPSESWSSVRASEDPAVLLQAHEIVHAKDDVLMESDTDDESSDEGQVPLVEISSKDPMAAARAAAILKVHHEYVEEQTRIKLRRARRSGSFGSPATPPTRQYESLADKVRRRSSLASVPVSPELLREAEREVATPPPVARAFALLGDTPETPQAGPSQPRYATPVHRPQIPIVVIQPASTRPSDEERGEDDRPWTKAEWKHLERCLLDERRSVAQGRGVPETDVDASEINVDKVVQRFIKDETLVGDEDGWQGTGDWSYDKIRRRCIALQVRHTCNPSGATSVPGSPMVIPFTPLPSRQPSPVSLFPTDTPTHRPTQRLIPPASVAPAPPLPPSLHAPRYAHLYGEAASIAGINLP